MNVFTISLFTTGARLYRFSVHKIATRLIHVNQVILLKISQHTEFNRTFNDKNEFKAPEVLKSYFHRIFRNLRLSDIVKQEERCHHALPLDINLTTAFKLIPVRF